MTSRSAEYRVGLVVDPQAGERLREIAARMHVWVVDAPVNRAVVEQLWSTAKGYDDERGATIFKATAGRRADEWAAEILDIILVHHGEYSHDPPVNALEIRGATLTPQLRTALAECGFTDVRLEDGALVARDVPSA